MWAVAVLNISWNIIECHTGRSNLKEKGEASSFPVNTNLFSLFDCNCYHYVDNSSIVICCRISWNI